MKDKTYLPKLQAYICRKACGSFYNMKNRLRFDTNNKCEHKLNTSSYTFNLFDQTQNCMELVETL